MSQIDIKSPKHCAKKGGLSSIGNLYKKLFFIFSTLFISILSIILLIWLILHPEKPQFSLKQADIYLLNLSSDHLLLNSSIQITLLSTNPNRKVGIYYDSLQAYASYKGQQITVHASLPPFYQGHEDTNLLTASLAAVGIPVGPSFGYEVRQDQISGKLVLSLKANGRIRWKVGAWVSGGYHLNVNCVAVMAFGPTIPSGPLSTKQGTQCSTAI